MPEPAHPDAYLIDLDGTLYVGAEAVPGATGAVARIRAARIPFRCVTNTTSRSRTLIVERLRSYGFDIASEEVFTATLAGAELARARGHHRLAPFVPEAALQDLHEFELVGGTFAPSSPSRVSGPAARPDVVLIGDLGERWSYGLMQEAFEYLSAGAELMALSRDRYWRRGAALALDAGPFVAGLEYATGLTATVAGKPSPAFFHAALTSLGLGDGAAGRRIAMVGDDLWSDVQGAQGAGLEGWLVRTGKFREESLRESGIQPDRVLASIADIGCQS